MNQPSSYEQNSTYNKWTPFVEQRKDDSSGTNSTEMQHHNLYFHGDFSWNGPKYHGKLVARYTKD